MGIKIYYYWYFDELKNTIKLNHTNGSIPVDPDVNKRTRLYTSIADAMRNAPTFAEQINV